MRRLLVLISLSLLFACNTEEEMTAKPTTLPRWSTDMSNMTAPSSGQMDTGWTPNQDGVSDYDNYIKYWTYKWVEWLNDAAFNTGIGSYAITASKTNYNPLGTGALANVRSLYLTPDADWWTIFSLVAGLDGQEVDIVNASSSFNLSIRSEDGGSTAANRFSFPQAYSDIDDDILILPRGSVRIRYDSAISRWRVLSTTGCMMYQQFVIPASAAAVAGTGGGASYHATGHVVLDKGGDASAWVYYPVILPQGAILDAYYAHYKKNSSAATTINFALVRRANNSDTVTGIGGGTSDNTNATGYQTKNEQGLLYQTLQAESYFLEVVSDDAGTNDWVLNMEIWAFVRI